MELPADVHGKSRTWHYEVPEGKVEGKQDGAEAASAAAEAVSSGPLDVILFYKYVVLDAAAISAWQRELCTELELTGRVLVGPEGINGTLAGTPEHVAAYIARMDAHERFGGVDWKHSESRDDPFPDLHIKVVKEIISTGGVIPNDFTNAGKHLAPADFHKKLVEATEDDSVILDVRNYKEYSVGHFDGAIRSEMRVFSEFPRFIDKNVEQFQGKKVMMYCTGGIRCEKASAYLKSKGIEEVYQLKGGIHRYLEAYPDGGQFRGKNFVFDKRIMLPPPGAAREGEAGKKATPEVEVVGRCEYCDAPYDELDGSRVCTVCRDLVLCCTSCQAKVSEYHCEHHMHLKDVYFTFLDKFTVDELVEQKRAMKAMVAELLGRRNRNRRTTLNRQIAKIDAHIAARLTTSTAAEASPADAAPAAGAGAGAGAGTAPTATGCRTCATKDCNGRCWGFWKEEQGDSTAAAAAAVTPSA